MADEKATSTRGLGITLVVFGVLAVLIGLLGSIPVILLGLGMIAYGVVAIRRHGQPVKPTLNPEPSDWKPTAMIAPIVAAIGFSVWGVVAGAPLLLVFAALWALMAGAQIWRATHG